MVPHVSLSFNLFCIKLVGVSLLSPALFSLVLTSYSVTPSRLSQILKWSWESATYESPLKSVRTNMHQSFCMRYRSC